MAKTSTKVFIMEVMGRHAGWIAAAGGPLRKTGDAAYHPVSGNRFDEEKFCARQGASKFGYRAVASPKA
jgi:6-phosphofructokinase 1